MVKEKLGEAFVEVPVDTDQFRDDINQMEGRVKKLGNRMRSIGRKMTLGLTVPITAGFGLAIRESMKLQGQLDKFKVVFDGVNNEMMSFVDNMNRNFPVAREQVVSALSSFGDLLKPMGIATDQASRMSKQWFKLAVQLAAFNDVPIPRVLEAIKSGMAGMSRPLRQFGIDARETKLEQFALAQGIKEAGEEMNVQQRQLALLRKAQKQSKDAVQGFEKQLGSTRLIQQDFTSSLRDLGASFGDIVRPAWDEAVKMATRWVDSMKRTSRSTKVFLAVVSGAAGAMGPFIHQIGLLLVFGPQLISNLKSMAMWMGMVAAPTLGLVAVLGTLATVIALAANHFDSFAEFGKEADERMRGIIPGWGDMFQDVGGAIDSFIKGARKDLTKDLTRLFVQVQNKGAISGFFSFISNKFNRVSEVIGNFVSDAKKWLVKKFKSNVMQPFKNMWDDIKNKVQTTADILMFNSTIPDMVSGISTEFNMLKQELPKDVQTMVNRVIGLYQKMADEAGKQSKKAAEQSSKIPEKAKEKAEETEKVFGDMEKNMKRISDTIESSITNAMADILVNMENVATKIEDVLKNILKQILKVAIRTQIVKPAVEAIFPGKASGGPVERGQSYVVGEKGPEIFTPDQDGHIIPNKNISSGGRTGGSGGAGGTITLRIKDESGDNVEVSEAGGSGGNKMVDIFLQNAAQDIVENGRLGQTIAKTFGLNRKGSRRT